MEFVIAGEIRFSTVRLTLENVATGDEIHMPPSAVFIMLILLRNHGKIVERNSFINTAWTEFGLELSGNTLNQYISVIRKNLSRLGLDSEAIITVPRVGFYFSELLKVESSEKGIPSKNLKPHKKLCIIFLTVLLIITEVFILQKGSRDRMNYELTTLGMIDKCEVYSTHNLTDTYAHVAMTLAKEASLKYLPCHENSVFIFDADSGIVFQNDGRFFLSRCDVSPVTGKFAGCHEALIYETR